MEEVGISKYVSLTLDMTAIQVKAGLSEELESLRGARQEILEERLASQTKFLKSRMYRHKY